MVQLTHIRQGCCKNVLCVNKCVILMSIFALKQHSLYDFQKLPLTWKRLAASDTRDVPTHTAKTVEPLCLHTHTEL